MRSPRDVLALGQVIVRELELNDRGAVLERWLAHHLAELISEADGAVGTAKAAAKQQAVDLILKLWMHRRALPEPVDPLSGYRNAIAVLGRLMPEADPWKRYRRHGSYDDLLHDMFETLSRVVLSGVLLTQVTRTRSIAAVESKALEEEEVFLLAQLDQWMPFINLLPQRPKIEIKGFNPNMMEDGEDQDDSSEVDQDDHTPEQHGARAEAAIHSAIVASLERMQTDLATLLTRWRNAVPNESEDDEVDGSGFGESERSARTDQ